MADPSSTEGTILQAELNVAGEYMLSLVINGQDAPQATNSLLVSRDTSQNARDFLLNHMIRLYFQVP